MAAKICNCPNNRINGTCNLFTHPQARSSHKTRAEMSVHTRIELNLEMLVFEKNQSPLSNSGKCISYIGILLKFSTSTLVIFVWKPLSPTGDDFLMTFDFLLLRHDYKRVSAGLKVIRTSSQTFCR